MNHPHPASSGPPVSVGVSDAAGSNPSVALQSGFSRRAFLAGASAVAGVAGMNASLGGAIHAGESVAIIDVNVTLGRWPLRRVPGDEPADLVERLRAGGIRQAWAGSFEALLHKDVAGVNRRLVAACRRHGRGMLQPFGVVNPALPDWEEELRRCAVDHRMKGIRLYPNYHGYDLADPMFLRLLREATAHRLIVQIPLILEDERMMHPRLRVPAVDTTPLAALVRNVPGVRLVLLNAQRTLRGPAMAELLQTGGVWVDIAMLEGVGGVGNLLSAVPTDRVLFGSHAPLFYVESSLLKLRESVLTTAQAQAVRAGNAARLLAAAAAG